jgi:hypothetical protein
LALPLNRLPAEKRNVLRFCSCALVHDHFCLFADGIYKPLIKIMTLCAITDTQN